MNDAADSQRLIEMGREALRIEARALAALVERLGTDFDKACRMLLECTGRVVVSGMGKSGHIGGKIAATPSPAPAPRPFSFTRQRRAMAISAWSRKATSWSPSPIPARRPNS
jgi:hypothetical protein